MVKTTIDKPADFAAKMSGKSVDEILNEGSPGLQYWAQLESRYVRAFKGIDGYGYQELAAKYDEQRGMNLAKLEATANGLEKMLKAADEQWTEQDTLAKKMPSYWQGAAANAGLTMLNQQLERATSDRQEVRKAMEAIKASITPFRDAVIAKASLTFGLLGGNSEVLVDGKTPEDIDNIISGAQSGALASQIFGGGTLLGKLTEIFPDLSPSNSPVNAVQAGLAGNFVVSLLQGDLTAPGYLGEDSAYNHKVKTRCQDWLDDIFKVQYDAFQKLYVSQCDETHRLFEAQYTTLNAALKELDDDPYPAPAAEKAAAPSPSAPAPSTPSPASPAPSTPSPASPSPTTPSPAGTPTTGTPTTGTPTSTTPASTNTALSGLASTLATALTTAASTFATVATTGLTALGTAISEAVEDLTDEDKDDDGKKDDEKKDDEKKTKSTEFDLAGKHYKLEVGEDGTPKLVETDKEGKTHEYSVKLDSNGNPIISDEEKKEEKKTEDKTQQPTAGTPTTGLPTTGTPKKGAQDGEHTPKTAPVTGEPKQEPVQTGAELSEAGPL
ncbi:hypothetical protein [Nocardia goodfellowii]|uniref:WXG100 family type VII secretion target n=1 Tax=Nocardia goodfellowii TaxID=882446 RepID=A0ABS4Q6L7_9NOCA|nr:hypothetical protein [Nocardia goodfellowii]MBP2187334.1 hypothetical protein [Nocardia goodfellowii]